MSYFKELNLFLASGCPVEFAKLGCYNDDQNNPRPLPDELFNDRGAEFQGYTGIPIDFEHWEKYSPDFVCRCAMETKKRGFKVFGVQFFGNFRIFPEVYPGSL